MERERFVVLKQLLSAIKAADRDYSTRYGLVLAAVAEAHKAGLHAGFRCDSGELEWPVAYIELPTGQVSWHVPQHPIPWDGHSTQEKYERIEQFLQAQ